MFAPCRLCVAGGLAIPFYRQNGQFLHRQLFKSAGDWIWFKYFTVFFILNCYNIIHLPDSAIQSQDSPPQPQMQDAQSGNPPSLHSNVMFDSWQNAHNHTGKNCLYIASPNLTAASSASDVSHLFNQITIGLFSYSPPHLISLFQRRMSRYVSSVTHTTGKHRDRKSVV